MNRSRGGKRNTPPKDTRFKPGESGNKGGRPKGSVSFQNLVERELRKSIVIPENGRQKRLTKKELLVRRISHDAMKGDYKAIAVLLRLGDVGSYAGTETAEGIVRIPDKSALKLIARRLKNYIDEDDHG